MIHTRHPTPEPATNCGICNRPLGTSPDTVDCGGDCLRCMAEAGDPDCILHMLIINCKQMKAALELVNATITYTSDELSPLYRAQEVINKAIDNATWQTPALLKNYMQEQAECRVIASVAEDQRNDQ